MDFLNLDSRSSKLQKEQQKRRDAAKLRIQRERRSKEAAARDQAKIEEQIRARKLEQRRKEEEVRKQEEADKIRTAGVSYKESLLAVVADGEGDKLLLPPSALESLSRQDAVSMGPMLFELTRTKPGQRAGEKSESVSRTTHAGVLEFVADEGTVGLPRKVVLSLLGATAHQMPVGKSGEKEDPLHHRQADRPATDRGGSGSDADGGGGGGRGDQQGAAARPAVEGLGHVVVRYVRLAKATFARVVPETVGLSQVSELRATLEHNMRNHATLTVGDNLSVWRRGKEFSLKVVELRPEPQVTVIDTDMEIELDLPEEAKEKLEEKSAQDRAKTMRAHMGGTTSAGQSLSLPANAIAGGGVVLGGGRTLAGRGSGRGSGSGSGSGRASPMDESDDDSDLDSDDEESGGANNIFDPEKHRLFKLQGLPEEPDQLDDAVFTCQLRTSQGKNTRRFRFEDKLEVLLDFAEALGGVPGQYRLLIPFPRRVLTREDAAAGMTLREAGLTSKQESVIVERV